MQLHGDHPCISIPKHILLLLPNYVQACDWMWKGSEEGEVRGRKGDDDVDVKHMWLPQSKASMYTGELDQLLIIKSVFLN